MQPSTTTSKSAESGTTLDVRKALEDCASGRDAKQYQALVEELKTCEDTQILVKLLQAIASWASVIGHNHERFKELLVMLFSFDWDIADEKIMLAFEDVLVSLVSSNIAFLDEAFRLLVRNFARDSDDDAGDDAGNAAGDEENQQSAANNDSSFQQLRKVRLTHLHETIQRILRICPLGCSTLLNIIIEYFPRQQESSRIQCEFTREALRVGENVPVLQDRLIRMAIKSLLDLDLELTSSIVIDRSTIIRTGDDSEGESGDESEDDEDGGMPAKKKQKLSPKVLEVADKVDSMLCVLFDYFDQRSAMKLTSIRTTHLIRSVIDSFDKEILRCGGAKFSQFFVFYCLANKPQYAEMFCDMLYGRILDEKENIFVRENSCKFLGSFLARAKYLSLKQIKAILTKFAGWIHEQALEFETISKSGNSKGKKRLLKQKSQILVAALQALLYVVIFKGGILGGWDFIEKSLGGEKWNALCSTTALMGKVSVDIHDEYINFLKRDQEKAQSESLKAHLHSFSSYSAAAVQADDDAVEDEEPSAMLKESVANPAKPIIVLEFPFDPLVLERSSQKVETLYQEWYSSERPSQESDEESSDDEGEAEEDAADESEFADEDLLRKGASAQLPKPIRIERIRRMLGGSWVAKTGLENGGGGGATDRTRRDSDILFPSPHLRPAVPSGSSSLSSGGNVASLQPLMFTNSGFTSVATANAIAAAQNGGRRERSLSAVSTGSW